MKILILYASRSGVTARAATLLTESLRTSSTFETDCCLFTEVTDRQLQEADAIIVGSSVHYNRVLKECRKWSSNVSTEVRKKVNGAFLIMGYPLRVDEYAEFFKKNFTELFFEPANFGGELKPKNHKGFDRLIVSSMRRNIREADFENGFNETVLPEMIPENIEVFAHSFKKRLAEN